MLKVGLSGGIGSGKTTVANLFAELGVPVIDTDAISHQLSHSDEVIELIREAFGEQVIGANGKLDRRALASIVFHDEDKREQLETIMHPRIRERIDQLLNNIEDAPYAILVVPLLLETDYHEAVDRILIVDAPEDEQLQRVTQRDGRDEQAVRAIMDNQLSRRERLQRADDVINNRYSRDYLRQLKIRVDDLDQLYRELGAKR